MTPSAERYGGGSLTNKVPKGTIKMETIKKVTIQDLFIIAAVATIVVVTINVALGL